MARRKVTTPHPTWSTLDVDSRFPAARAFFFFEPFAHVPRHVFQLFRIQPRSVRMNAMTRMRLNHSSEFLIAADRTQLGVGQPLPRRTLLFQVIEKTFRTGD